MKTKYLLFSLLLLPLLLFAEDNKSEIREKFKDKQGVMILENEKKHNIIYIKASISASILKKKYIIEKELKLKTKKILHWHYSRKEKYRNKNFTLDVKNLTHDYYWKDNNFVNLISNVDESLISVILYRKEKKQSAISIIKNILADNIIIPNSVEMLRINGKKYLISLVIKDKVNSSAQEKINTYKVFKRKAQKILVEFIHGENISVIESIKTIVITNKATNQDPIRYDILEFNEELRSEASGALAKNRTFCWDKAMSYYCISYVSF